MVTIVHIYNRWTKSEIKVYVDGKEESHGEMTWLVNTSDVSSLCAVAKKSQNNPDLVGVNFCSAIHVKRQSTGLIVFLMWVLFAGV